MLITDRVRAARAGTCVTPEFLARDMGRSYGREWVEQRQAGTLIMPANPYSEVVLRVSGTRGSGSMCERRSGRHSRSGKEAGGGGVPRSSLLPSPRLNGEVDQSHRTFFCVGP